MTTEQQEGKIHALNSAVYTMFCHMEPATKKSIIEEMKRNSAKFSSDVQNFSDTESGKPFNALISLFGSSL